MNAYMTLTDVSRARVAVVDVVRVLPHLERFVTTQAAPSQSKRSNYTQYQQQGTEIQQHVVSNDAKAAHKVGTSK